MGYPSYIVHHCSFINLLTLPITPPNPVQPPILFEVDLSFFPEYHYNITTDSIDCPFDIDIYTTNRLLPISTTDCNTYAHAMLTIMNIDYVTPGTGANAPDGRLEQLRKLVGADLPHTFRRSAYDGIGGVDGVCVALKAIDGVRWPDWDETAMCRLLMVGKYAKALTHNELTWLIRQCRRVEVSQFNLVCWCLSALHDESIGYPGLLERTKMLVSSHHPIPQRELLLILALMPSHKGTTLEDSFAMISVLDELLEHLSLQSLIDDVVTRARMVHVCTILMWTTQYTSVLMLERLLRHEDTYRYVSRIDLQYTIPLWVDYRDYLVEAGGRMDDLTDPHIQLVCHMCNLLRAIERGEDVEAQPGPASLRDGVVVYANV